MVRLALILTLSLLSTLGSSCGGAAPRCSSSTCPVGCCDSDGLCQGGNSLSACGIGGNTCKRCTVTETCMQGLCVTGGTGFSGGSAGTGGGNAGGGAVGGGSPGGGSAGGVAGGAAGGSSGGGSTGGGSVGGGAAGPTLEVVPASATVPEQHFIDLSGRVVNGVDNGVDFSLMSGTGSLSRSGPSAATYFAASADATVRILASSTLNPSLNRVIDITVAAGQQAFFVEPDPYSFNGGLAPGSRQTFSAVRPVVVGVSPWSSLVGVRGVQWQVWPMGTIDSTGTLTAETVNQRVYAREVSTNLWASTPVWVQPTSLPSIAIAPAFTVVSPGTVVQFTATVSTGATATWSVVSANGGTVNQSGTYTAPFAAGVYLVEATVGSRLALATVVVQ